MNINWFKIYGSVAIIIVIAFLCYGAYRFYFDKPVPVVNNVTAMPGSNFDVKQGSESKLGRLFTGLSGNKDTLMVQVGWIW